MTTRRIGHKGADHIAPGNTLASFDAAIEAGADMIEFDVLSENRDGTGELWLAHDYDHIDDTITLDIGLDHLAKLKVDLLVDLKLSGYEDRVVAALRKRKLLKRALVTTMEPSSLPILRELEPKLPIGRSVPKVKRNYLARRTTKLIAGIGVHYLRRTLPRKLAREIQAGRIDAVSAHYSVVTPQFVRAIHLVGGQLYVWTVDDARAIAHFIAIDADGIITNDPRLFDRAGGG